MGTLVRHVGKDRQVFQANAKLVQLRRVIGIVFQPRTIRSRALRFVIGAIVAIAVPALIYVLVLKPLMR